MTIFFYLFIYDESNEYFLNKRINIGLVSYSIKNGGVERTTSLMCYYFNKVKIFKLTLFTFKEKEKNEYSIDNNIERVIVRNNLHYLIVIIFGSSYMESNFSKAQSVTVDLFLYYNLYRIYIKFHGFLGSNKLRHKSKNPRANLWNCLCLIR